MKGDYDYTGRPLTSAELRFETACRRANLADGFLIFWLLVVVVGAAVFIAITDGVSCERTCTAHGGEWTSIVSPDPTVCWCQRAGTSTLAFRVER